MLVFVVLTYGGTVVLQNVNQGTTVGHEAIGIVEEVGSDVVLFIQVTLSSPPFTSWLW